MEASNLIFADDNKIFSRISYPADSEKLQSCVGSDVWKIFWNAGFCIYNVPENLRIGKP